MFSNFRNKYNSIPTKSIILNKILPFFNSKRSHFSQDVLISPQKRPNKKRRRSAVQDQNQEGCYDPQGSGKRSGQALDCNTQREDVREINSRAPSVQKTNMLKKRQQGKVGRFFCCSFPFFSHRRRRFIIFFLYKRRIACFQGQS